MSHGDKDVQVEAVVRLSEEEDEDKAEETGASQTPVQPRQLWIKEKGRERGKMFRLDCEQSFFELPPPPTSALNSNDGESQSYNILSYNSPRVIKLF